MEQRLAARRLLAAVREGDQRTWHRAAMTAGKDEQVAAKLSMVGRRAVERGGQAAASVAFERAVELSARPDVRAASLASAAVAAFNAGHLPGPVTWPTGLVTSTEVAYDLLFCSEWRRPPVW